MWGYLLSLRTADNVFCCRNITVFDYGVLPYAPPSNRINSIRSFQNPNSSDTSPAARLLYKRLVQRPVLESSAYSNSKVSTSRPVRSFPPWAAKAWSMDPVVQQWARGQAVLHGSELLFHLDFPLMLPSTLPAASASSRAGREEEDARHVPGAVGIWGRCLLWLLSPVVLLEESSPWGPLTAPLQGEVGLRAQKNWGKSCPEGPPSLLRMRESLPPTVLGFGASTETKPKCPI